MKKLKKSSRSITIDLNEVKWRAEIRQAVIKKQMEEERKRVMERLGVMFTWYPGKGPRPVIPSVRVAPALNLPVIFGRLTSPEVEKIHIIVPLCSPCFKWDQSPMFNDTLMNHGMTIKLTGGVIEFEHLNRDVITLEFNGRIFTTVVLVDISIRNVGFPAFPPLPRMYGRGRRDGRDTWGTYIQKLELKSTDNTNIEELLLAYLRDCYSKEYAKFAKHVKEAEAAKKAMRAQRAEKARQAAVAKKAKEAAAAKKAKEAEVARSAFEAEIVKKVKEAAAAKRAKHAEIARKTKEAKEAEVAKTAAGHPHRPQPPRRQNAVFHQKQNTRPVMYRKVRK